MKKYFILVKNGQYQSDKKFYSIASFRRSNSHASFVFLTKNNVKSYNAKIIYFDTEEKADKKALLFDDNAVRVVETTEKEMQQAKKYVIPYTEALHIWMNLW